MTERAFDPHIDLLIAQARMVDTIDASLFRSIFRVCLGNAGSSVQMSDGVSERLWHVMNAFYDLMTGLRDREIAAQQGVPFEAARQAFIVEVEKLRDELKRCEPSNMARALVRE